MTVSRGDVVRAGRLLGVGGGIAALMLALYVLVASVSGVSLISALLVPTTSPSESPADSLPAGQDRLSEYVAQIDGRTMFFTPAPPPPRPVITANNDDGLGVDPPPARYGGPKVIGLLNDTVWFSDKRQAIVGGEAVGDLRVISTDAPWSVTVQWQGVEFDVPFLARDSVVLAGDEESARAEALAPIELALSESGSVGSAASESAPGDEPEDDQTIPPAGVQPGDQR